MLTPARLMRIASWKSHVYKPLAPLFPVEWVVPLTGTQHAHVITFCKAPHEHHLGTHAVKCVSVTLMKYPAKVGQW